jgi:hypothetical protein
VTDGPTTVPQPRPLSLATACDNLYAARALNLIGSVQRNSDIFDRIFVYDLGMDAIHRWLFADLPNVTVARVPNFCAHSHQCWGWKAWIWTHTAAELLLYLDAGVEVLRPLEPCRALIDRDGYLLVSQSDAQHPHRLIDIVPADYYGRFGVDQSTNQTRDVVAAGVIGFRPGGAFTRNVIEPVYDAICAGANLGWSQRDVESRNRGLNYMPNPPLRDCAMFRHDQTVLNLCLYKAYARPHVQDVFRFAGRVGPNDHPEQLLWVHRNRSELPYVWEVSYAARPCVHRAIMRLSSRLVRRMRAVTSGLRRVRASIARSPLSP